MEGGGVKGWQLQDSSANLAPMRCPSTRGSRSAGVDEDEAAKEAGKGECSAHKQVVTNLRNRR